MSKTERERSLAVFVDLENLAMGFRTSARPSSTSRKSLSDWSKKGS